MVPCLVEARPICTSLAGNRRAVLVRRLREHFEGQGDLPVYVTDLC
jgi:hypothetical protein